MTHIIRYTPWRPFKTDEGNRDVLRLNFQFDRQIIDIIKEVMNEYKDENGKPVGGYLPASKCWYWKAPWLPALKNRLVFIGVELLPEKTP